MIGSRREARETALGLLYEADVRGETVPDTLARQIVPPVEYAQVLLNGVAEHLSAFFHGDFGATAGIGAERGIRASHDQHIGQSDRVASSNFHTA